MSKAVIFVLGFAVGGASLFFIGKYLGVTDLNKSATERALAARIESISIEKICVSIVSGKQILGADHITVWSDGRRYVLGAWQMEKSGTPVFYWTGADLPADIPGCKKKVS